MSNQEKNSSDAFGQNVEMLEQILEVMPDDLVTLRALYETSLKMGNSEKAFQTLARLDDQARATQDLDVVDFVLNEYLSIPDDSVEIQGRIARLQEMKGVAGPIQEGASTFSPAGVRSSVEDRLNAEMALAWDLFQDEQLSQEEYSDVLHDLTEMSSQKMGVPVTTLHILHDRQFGRMERLITYLSKKHNIPVIMLSSFEGNEGVCEALPLEFISANGILPFEQVGNELLVAVLNPRDQKLLEQAQTVSGKHCHCYLVAPDEYDRQLAKLKQNVV